MNSTQLKKIWAKKWIPEDQVKRTEIGFNRGIIEIDNGGGGESIYRQDERPGRDCREEQKNPKRTPWSFSGSFIMAADELTVIVVVMLQMSTATTTTTIKQKTLWSHWWSWLMQRYHSLFNYGNKQNQWAAFQCSTNREPSWSVCVDVITMTHDSHPCKYIILYWGYACLGRRELRGEDRKAREQRNQVIISCSRLQPRYRL